MTDQPTPPLHEQVRTLEADLVMCREQLAQESERAEKALPEPDPTNPTHWRWAAQVVEDEEQRQPLKPSFDRGDHYHLEYTACHLRAEADRLEAAQHLPSDLCGDLGPDSLVKCTRPHGHDGDHWHTGLDGKSQAWAYACADIEPDSLVRCQRPKGHPGDHRYEDRYGNGIGWQADADEELIEKAARTLAFAVERNDLGVTESEMWARYLVRESRRRYLDQARALLAANLLRDGGEK